MKGCVGPEEALKTWTVKSSGSSEWGKIPTTPGQDMNLSADQLLRSLAIIHDLGEKYQKAIQNHSAVNAMLLAFVHDLRTPMTVISSCAQSCVELKGLSHSAQKKLQMIWESSKQASALIRSFLDFSFSHFAEYKLVQINEILLRAWDLAKIQNHPCSVTLQTRLDENLPKVQANPEKVERIFLNLLNNAIQALPTEGKIRVRTRLLRAENRVEARVMDNGPGIPKNLRERIFAPFYTTKDDGSGLGLYACKSMVAEHKGTITLHSKVNRGTLFSVKLPINPDSASCPQAEPTFIVL